MGDRPHIDPKELETGLTRLGLRELEERMEISPLLITAGADTVTEQGTICCTCKIPGEDYIGKDGMLPYPQIQENLLSNNTDSVTWLR